MQHNPCKEDDKILQQTISNKSQMTQNHQIDLLYNSNDGRCEIQYVKHCPRIKRCLQPTFKDVSIENFTTNIDTVYISSQWQSDLYVHCPKKRLSDFHRYFLQIQYWYFGSLKDRKKVPERQIIYCLTTATISDCDL